MSFKMLLSGRCGSSRGRRPKRLPCSAWTTCRIRSRPNHGLLGRGGALARAPGQKETACAVEGALGMSEKNRDIDALLRRNVERQLAGFDWEGFRRGIGGRLTSAGARSRAWNRYGRWAAMAAAHPGRRRTHPCHDSATGPGRRPIGRGRGDGGDDRNARPTWQRPRSPSPVRKVRAMRGRDSHA